MSGSKKKEADQEVAARKKIEESESRYRELVKSLPIAVYTCDVAGHILLYNQAAVKLLWGIEPEPGIDLWNKGLNYYTPDGEPLPFEQVPIAVTLREGKSISFEVRVKRPDGTERNVIPHPRPLFDDNGKLIGALNMLEDVTDARRASEIDSMLAAIIQSSEDAIVSKTLTGVVTSWNPGAEKLFGYSAEEMIGQPITKIIPYDRQNEEPEILRRIQNGESVDHFETKRITKDGKLLDISLTISPVKNSAGKIVGASKIARDITNAKKAEATLKESERQLRELSASLEEKVNERTRELLLANNELLFANQRIELTNLELQRTNKELESFTYISSHDLQEPIRKIQTFATRILQTENQNLSDNGKQLLRRMKDAAARMQTLIQDLLSFSRINTSERKFEDTDLSLIINEVKDEFSELINEKNATIEVGPMCNVEIIRFQFRQLIHNLISNSLKFMKPGGTPYVLIRSASLNPSELPGENKRSVCHISYMDNGIGFEPRFSEKIFEVFQKLHDKETYPGTGIGLAIVKKIVENHHGRITATSELGKGARFDIYFPLKQHPNKS